MGKRVAKLCAVTVLSLSYVMTLYALSARWLTWLLPVDVPKLACQSGMCTGERCVMALPHEVRPRDSPTL